MSTKWSKTADFYMFLDDFIWLVVRLDILRLYKDNTFGVKNTGLEMVKSGWRWRGRGIWWVRCGWEYGVYLVYSDLGLCAVWYEFIGVWCL